jgi:hypothetical protein
MGAKKRQTMGKIMRERERAEKRARKQEKKDEKKAVREAEAAGLPYPLAGDDELEEPGEAAEAGQPGEPDEPERSAVTGAPPGTSVS